MVRRAALVVLALVGGLLTGPVAPPAAATGPVSGDPAAFSAAVPVCGVLRPTARPALIPATPRVIRTGGPVDDLVVGDGKLHVLDGKRHVVRVFALDGALLRTVDLRGGWALAVDPAGAIYTVDADLALVKLSPAGDPVWRRPWRDLLPEAPSALAGVQTPQGWRLAVSDRSSATVARLVSPAGAVTGTAPYGTTGGGRTTALPDGGVVVRDEGSVRRYAASGALVDELGAAARTGSRAGAAYRPATGSAVLTADGTYLLPSGYSGIAVAGTDGVVTGLVSSDALGRLTQNPSAVLAGSDLYYASGGPWNDDQTVSVLPVDTVRALAAPLDPPRLGVGAGLTTAAAGNWFRSGTAPVVRAEFDPSWARRPGTWTLSYTVRSAAQVRSRTAVASATVPVAAAATAGGVPLVLPAARPGAYEVDARLLKDGVPVSGTCLHYTVGAPDHALDLAALPPGADAGGPSPARAVALADVLGTGLARVQLDWSRLLPDPAGPYRWEAYDAELAAAAREAARRGVVLDVQLGQGAMERRFVDDGSWERRVRDVVQHYAGSVDVWEAWNEPNATFGPPADYVAKVLAPVARAVRAADPGARVVGGSVVGLDLGYWHGVIAAGGLAHLDVAGIHPYPGHNRSYEEQGTPAQLRQLLGMLHAVRPGLPVWNTEAAWWSNGSFDYWAQADYSARAQLWHKALGVERWGYFIPEGSWGDYGVSFSAVQVDDEVKPAALALMTSRSVLGGRRFLGWVDTGVPHVYAARLSATTTDPATVLAVWSDDRRSALRLVSPSAAGTAVALVDQLGRKRALTVAATGTALRATGSVQYLVGAGADRLAVRPAESYGANLLLGAAATASSAQPTNPPARAVDGRADAAGAGNWTEVPGWASQSGDVTPVLTLRLAQRATLNRLVVGSHSVASVAPGLRTYQLQVRDGDAAAWTTVGTVRNAFFERTVQRSFAARPVTEVRVVVTAVNYSGYAGGAPPTWWPVDTRSMTEPGSTWAGPAIVTEIAGYGPGA